MRHEREIEHNKAVGQRIRQLRKAQSPKMNTEELGQRIGTSGAHVRRMQSGEVRMHRHWIDKIAQALNCEPHEIDPTLAAAHELERLREENADLRRQVLFLRRRLDLIATLVGESTTQQES